ncbi:plasmid stabilization system protein [Methanofollis liminatans DSM 4140]|uniref:Plasmid stabilization system protein n=1 Tax=Methanofollis liminatans DSM 4140 TaxID=28892 RepID=J0S851_9EURY|nr:plasmid stabilization system protein [Methanofollis liminatans DSM 4140]
MWKFASIRLPEADEQRIKDELMALADETYPHVHIKKLNGHPDAPVYALRAGQYRAILTIDGDIMVIFVIEVENRSTVYRK